MAFWDALQMRVHADFVRQSRRPNDRVLMADSAGYGKVNTTYVLYVSISAPGRKSFNIETLHLSCSSHEYVPGKRYAGFIIYGVDDDRQSSPYIIGGQRVRPGYVVICDTSHPQVQRAKSGEGVVHDKVFASVFDGASVKDCKVVGEGFSITNGEFVPNSATFNCGSVYHDSVVSMNPKTMFMVERLMDKWMAGAAGCCHQNFAVADLMANCPQIGIM